MTAVRAARDVDVLRSVCSYIPGPDMGTDERCMAWIHDEIGRSRAALPRVVAEELAAASLREAMSFRRSWSDGVSEPDPRG